MRMSGNNIDESKVTIYFASRIDEMNIISIINRGRLEEAEFTIKRNEVEE
jgi:hypothetical protein